MNIKSILVLLLSGLYVFTCHYWYCCKVQSACYGCAATAQSTVPVVASLPPIEDQSALRFAWSKNSVMIKEGFEEEKAKWLNDKGEDNLFEITGTYFKEETTPEGFENLGLARARAIRNLLLSELPDERIRLKGKMIPIREGVRSNPFSSIQVKWISVGLSASEVIDLGDKAIILFPSNSYKKETDEDIDQYLEAIAKRVAKSGEIIFLTGHTDNAGELKANNKLGLKRAMRIRRILRQKGVSRDQIVASTKGEQEPIASNNTENGRYQNRRVVLEVKPAQQ